MSRGKQQVYGYDQVKHAVPMSGTSMRELQELGAYIAGRPDLCPAGRAVDNLIIAVAFARGVSELKKDAARDGWKPNLVIAEEPEEEADQDDGDSDGPSTVLVSGDSDDVDEDIMISSNQELQTLLADVR